MIARISRQTIVFSLVTVLVAGFVQAQVPSGSTRPIVDERILPATTKGVFLVTDAIELGKRWDATQLGQLMSDPVMKPFGEDLKRQFSERLSRLRERLGLGLDDLKGVPGGGLSIALTQPNPGEAAIGLLVDVTDHHAEAEKLLKKVAANLTSRGGQMSQQKVGKTTIIVFDLPATDERPAARVGYFLSGNLLGASDNLDLMKEVLQRQMGLPHDTGTLAEVPAFVEVMRRCQADAGGIVPQMRWYVEPLGYIEAVRATLPEAERRRNGPSLLDVFEKQGFESIRGIGGHIDLKAGPFELLHRTAFFAPKPYKPAPAPYEKMVPMKIFTFPNGTDFTPQAWVPGDIAAYTSFYWDANAAFANFGSIFDQMVGEGETGVWEDVLDSLHEDPKGPQIGLEKEIVKYLGQRVTVITDYQLPITPKSERLLIAIDLGDAKAVAAGIQKLFQDDPVVRRHEVADCVLWETLEEGQVTAEGEKTVVDLPQFAPEGQEEDDFEEEEAKPLLPNRTVTVAHGQLWIASHRDFLETILKKAKENEPLIDSMDYRVVQAAREELGVDASFLRSFSRTEEEFRPIYELIRQGKMPESETFFGRMLNALSPETKKGQTRTQKIDGKSLPDFQVVRRYLGPAGVFALSEENGWYVTGFMLKK